MKSVYLVMIVCLSFALTNTATLSSNASTPSPVISINGNSDLNSQATTNGWSGSGTSSDPYIISNYSISSSNQYSFVIQNTNLHVIFENNFLTNGIVGVFVQNVQNLVIKNNSITNCEKFGILIDESANNLIVNNTISHTSNGMGLLITNSVNNLFNNNTSEFNSNHGFFISQNTTNNTFE